MHLLSVGIIALALSGLGACRSCEPHHPARGLHSAMVSKGKTWFGTAFGNGTVRDDPDERVVLDNTAEIGSITPENVMKWRFTQASQGNFTFDAADAIVNRVESNGQQLHCHTLVWYFRLPSWVSEGNFDNKTLIHIMTTHIETVVGRYKGKCTRWDVVNEALNDDGTYRDNVFFRTIGEAYIPIAFRIAARADPKAKLFYNDYNIEAGGNKTEGVRRIVKLIKSYGVRIDGVGFQSHLTSEVTPSAGLITPSQEMLTSVLESVTSLGVDVAYTELDIRINLPSTEKKLNAQANAYRRVVGSCMAVKRCVGITVWGLSDRYNWIPQFYPNEGAASLWDENFKKKPAYYAALKAINIK